MDILKVLAMLVMLGLLLWGIIRKIDVAFLMWALGIASYIVLGFVLKTSPLKNATTGSLFLDGFSSFESIYKSQWASSCANITIVFGFVGIMKKWKVTELFVNIITRPIQKVVKNPYILAASTIMLGAFMQWAFNSTTTSAVLLLAIWYPVLLACGVSKPTAATAILIGCTYFRWGPADALTTMMIAAVNIPMTAPQWWLTYQIPFFMPLIVILLVLFPITSKFFDKREKAETGTGIIEQVDLKSFGIPKFYAVYPILPIILMILATFVKTITVSLIVAYMISFFFILIVEVIRKKTFASVANDTYSGLVNGIKDSMPSIVVIVGGALFSGALSAVGGMNVMIGWIGKLGGGAFAMAVLGIVFIFFIVMISSQSAPNIPTFAQFFMSISNITGGQLYPLLSVAATTVGFSSILCLVHPQTVLISNQCETTLPTLLKRVIPFFIIGAVASLVYSFVILGV